MGPKTFKLTHCRTLANARTEAHLTVILQGAIRGSSEPYNNRIDQRPGNSAQGDPRPVAMGAGDLPVCGTHA